jgi:hypothetical protein
VENPIFLFLGGSADVAAAAAPPIVPAARVASLVGRLAAGPPAPAPGAVSSAASVALGEGGEGSHLSWRVRPPSLSSSSSSDDEYSEVAGEESPSYSRSRNSSLLCSWCSLLTVKIRQPSHEFTFDVGMSFIPYPLVLTPVV